jgi:hypothetical protein
MTMVEPWVYDIDLGDVNDEFDGGEDSEIDPRVSGAFQDPDKPVNPANNKKRSTKQSRVGFASVACRQSNICIRKYYSVYLNDTLPDGIIHTVKLYVDLLTSLSTALEFSVAWCCDRHSGNNFNLSSFFPDSFFTDDEHPAPPLKRKRKSTKGQNRPTIDRKPLQHHLRAWRSKAHLLDPLRAVRPHSFICDDKSIVKLSTLRSDKVTCMLDIVRALEETEGWGAQVFDVIQAFDKAANSVDEDTDEEEDAQDIAEAEETENEEEADEEIIQPRRGTSVKSLD